ncbi:MAG: hypothetical protein EOO73_12030 [Myxococcales bacterium]|nr:MAG: hypothetical protein EOO73_12030 [Myxococcales bacterium]
MNESRRPSLAAVMLTVAALLASGCGGQSYVLSADYASNMNDAEWNIKHVPSAAPAAPRAAASAEPVTEAPSASSEK